MKRSSGPRKTASLSNAVHHQLNMYGLAAGAAGVSVLTLAQPAEAKIHYTKANVHIGNNQSYNLDLNHDGITDVTLLQKAHEGTSCNFPAVFFSVFEIPTAGNGVEGTPPTPLSYGARIGRGKDFYTGKGSLATSVFVFHGGFTCKHGGAWWNVKDHYLGVEFKIHKKIHFGWARLTLDRGREITLTGYAYEDILGKSIKAGKTKGPADEWEEDDFVNSAYLTDGIPDRPQPASLGMLAVGAQGVPLWRRKESALEGSLK